MRRIVDPAEMTIDPLILVVGAGIVGVTTALRLQRAGHRVLLIDREGPAAGCSRGNGGAIGQNICAPFTQPGLLRQIPGWYLDRDGPVVVSPAWAVRSLPWIVRWLSASRARPTYRYARGMAFLHHGCLDIYREMLGQDLYQGLIRDTGYLYVYETAVRSKSDVFAEALRKSMGIPGRHVTAAELRDMEPALSDRFKRGLLLPGNSFTVNPARLVETLFDLFMSAGGAFERTTLRHIERDGSRVVAVSTDRGVYRPGSLVICTGAWSAPFARSLGVRVPLVAERGYHVTFSGNPARINYKVMNASRGFGATQMQDGLQISGTVELADVDAPPDWSRARALARNARLMFREELGEPDGRWMGCRPSLPDSLPVVERVPSLANAYLNFGHSHWGLSGAPRSAEMIADLIAGLPAGPAAGTFASGRFRWGARPTDIDDPKCSRRT